MKVWITQDTQDDMYSLSRIVGVYEHEKDAQQQALSLAMANDDRSYFVEEFDVQNNFRKLQDK